MTPAFPRHKKGVFLVNCLGVVYNPTLKMIAIGRRRHDPYIKGLTWCFPGGRPHPGKSLEASLKAEIRKKTGLAVNVIGLVAARIPKEHPQFLLLYYYCETKQTILRAGEKFVDVAWIPPARAGRYFRTSMAPEIRRFLNTLTSK